MKSSQPMILGSLDAYYTMDNIRTNLSSSLTLSGGASMAGGKVAENILERRFWLTINAITVELMKR